MSQLPVPARLYIVAVVLAGALVLWITPGPLPVLSIIAFALAYAIMEAFPVAKNDQEFFSLAGSIACLGVAGLGLKAGMVAALVGLLLATIKLRLSWEKVVYNAGQLLCMVWLAGTVFAWLGGKSDGTATQVLFPFLAMYLIYWLTNSVFISLLLSLINQGTVGSFLRNGANLYVQQGLVMIINCAVLASYWAFREWALAVLVVVLLLVRYAMAAYDHARSFYIRIIQLLTGVMEAQDRFTHGHSERVAHYALAVGQTLRLPEAQLDLLRTAALLHDVGKMKIPREVLHKKTKLSDEEFDQIKEHPVTGAEWVGKLDPRGTLAKTIRHHHERWDGKGYPDGLAGQEIPELSRIITVVDAFDAMTSDRPYRSSMSTAKALSILRDNAGTQFDPRIVNAFLACAEEAIRDVPQTSLAIDPAAPQAQGQAEAAAAAAQQDDSPQPTDKGKRRSTKKPKHTEQAAGRV